MPSMAEESVLNVTEHNIDDLAFYWDYESRPEKTPTYERSIAHTQKARVVGDVSITRKQAAPFSLFLSVPSHPFLYCTPSGQLNIRKTTTERAQLIDLFDPYAPAWSGKHGRFYIIHIFVFVCFLFPMIFMFFFWLNLELKIFRELCTIDFSITHQPGTVPLRTDTQK